MLKLININLVNKLIFLLTFTVITSCSVNDKEAFNIIDEAKKFLLNTPDKEKSKKEKKVINQEEENQNQKQTDYKVSKKTQLKEKKTENLEKQKKENVKKSETIESKILNRDIGKKPLQVEKKKEGKSYFC